MSPSEIREMTDSELVEALAEAKEERFNLRFQLATNQLDNTIIMYTSDHGYSWGDHWWRGKNCLYEGCAQAPLVVRHPSTPTPGGKDSKFLMNIDLAPTIADLAGNPIGPALGLHIGCGADPSKPDRDKEIRRLEEKVKAGAEYVMTQPVYDPVTVERFLESIRHLEVPVLVGILPLYSHKNAEFLHNEVPGMTIPEDIRERMRRAGSGEAANAEGVAIAQEALRAARDAAQGAYIMPPFNKVELSVRVIEGLR